MKTPSPARVSRDFALVMAALAGIGGYFLGLVDARDRLYEEVLRQQATPAEIPSNVHWRQRLAMLEYDPSSFHVTRSTIPRTVSPGPTDGVSGPAVEETDELPALLVTVDSLRAYREQARIDAEEMGRLEAGLDRAARVIQATQAERDRWHGLADEAVPAIMELHTALNTARAGHACHLISTGAIRIGCPSRGTTALLAIGTTLLVEAAARGIRK